MAEPTVEEMLTNVRTAINNAILAGGLVEMELNGRRVKYDYDQLLAIEQKLVARTTSSGSNGPLRTYVNFGGRPS